MATLIKNGKILVLEQKNWIIGDLLIDDNGNISAIGKFDISHYPITEEIDASGKLIMPGIINAHSHSYTGLLKGTIDNVPLDIYMLLAIAGGTSRSPREIYISTMIDAIQMLKSGTTATIDHFSQRPYQEMEGIDAVIQAYVDVGMRATIAPMFADKSYFETVPMLPGEFPEELKGRQALPPQPIEDFGDVCIRAIKKWHGTYDRIRIMMGTDGPQRCSRELLDLTREIEKEYQIGWHTHVLEAKTQAIMGHKLHGKGLIEYLDEISMINERTSLVHFIWVSSKEMDIAKERAATVVHCPSTALHLGSGIAPVDQYLKKGLQVAIGTDGGNCGNLSMFEKIRLTALLHKVAQPEYENWISASDALRLAIKGGARAMLMENELGGIEVGKKADLTILDMNNILWQPSNHIVHQLVYGESGQSVDTVFVGGKKVLEKGKVLFINEEEIIEEAKEIVERLSLKNKEAFELVKRQIPFFRKMYLRAANEDLGFNRFSRPI